MGVAVAIALLLSGVLLFQSRSPYSHFAVHGDFDMTEMTGRPVTAKTLLGKPTVMYFGFTSCPDVCPTTLLMLSNVLQQIGREADRLNVVFVTVDPQRDTSAQMRLYLSSFDPRIRGFTGTDRQVAHIADAYHIFYRRVPIEGGGYTIDHFAGVLLIDKGGTVVGQLPYGEADTTVLAKLRTLIRPAACLPNAPPSVDLWTGATLADMCQPSRS